MGSHPKWQKVWGNGYAPEAVRGGGMGNRVAPEAGGGGGQVCT